MSYQCHSHHHQVRAKSENRLTIAIAISIVAVIIEIYGARLSNSLALLSDAGHIFTDVLTLSIGVIAIRLAKRAHTSMMTYGFHRAEVLAALVNGASLIGISGYIFYEAFLRFFNPPEVQAPILLAVAAIGFVANVGVTKLLWSNGIEDLNVRAIMLHSISDMLGSLGVICGAIILLFTGLTLIDPIIAIIIGGLILKNAIDVTSKAGLVLLEGVPREIDMELVTKELLSVEGVRGVHELHVWCITSGFFALTGHVTIENQMLSSAQAIMERINTILRDKFSIVHVTLQPELEQQVISIGREGITRIQQ
ncbi:MAG TPA: cation diffusion facilitator family transporter [Candidatus Acidoferrales bacterium]|nr:cation diffusion facilitator family transporter [Candidatus Acidoferrales bacterium]